MWKFLSYTLSENLTAYKNGKRINIVEERKIVNGDSCNQTSLELPSHLGTHIDFPYHFDESGKKGDKFQANEFVFNSIDAIEFSFFNNFFKSIFVITSPFITRNDFSLIFLPAFFIAPPVPRGLFSTEKVILTPSFLFFR